MAKRAANGGAKLVLRPVLRYFDRMFASLGERVDLRAREAAADLGQRVTLLESAVADVRRLGDDLHADARSLHELVLLSGLSAHPPRPAFSTASTAAEAPTSEEGPARITGLSKRIVEVPWAHARASRLEPASFLLDVGSTGGLLAVELATAGHQVIALGPRDYALEHPNVEVVVSALEDWDGPSRQLDAVFVISTSEHFGLGHSVDRPDREDLDRVAMERFASWLRPGAPLFLTLPYGIWQVSDLEHVYDAAHLDQLIKGWEVVERDVFAQRSPTEWQRLDASCIDGDWVGEAGVVLLELRRPG